MGIFKHFKLQIDNSIIMGNKLSKKKKNGSSTPSSGGSPVGDTTSALDKIINNSGKYDILETMGGSCECKKVRETETGKIYIVKIRKNKDQCLNEMRANKLYGSLGAAVPKTEMHSDPSTGLIITTQDFIEGKTLKEITESKDRNQITKAHKALGQHYLLDCLFSNWDVIGGRGGDNIIITDDDKAFRIDNAGVFGIRAQGEPRPSWGNEQIVSELYVMRDPEGNKQAADVFQHVSDHEIAHQFVALKNLLSEGFLEKDVFESTDHADLIILKSRIEWVEQFLQQSAPEVLLQFDSSSFAALATDEATSLPKSTSPRTTEAKIQYLTELGFSTEQSEGLFFYLFFLLFDDCCNILNE